MRVRNVALALAATGVALVASGCGSSTTVRSVACSVTQPQGTRDSGASSWVNYRNQDLGVVLWPRGHLVAGELPGGGSHATINENGSIDAKQGWWRWADGRLRVSGARIDASAPPLRAHVPDGYGSDGAQPVGLTFPTTGCWQIVGRVGNASLTYVVKVTKTTA